MAGAHVPDGSAPTDTFFRGTRELYFNDEPIEIIRAPSATSEIAALNSGCWAGAPASYIATVYRSLGAEATKSR